MRVPTGVTPLSSAPSSGPSGHLPPCGGKACGRPKADPPISFVAPDDSAGARAGRAGSSRPTKGRPPCGGGAPVRTLGRKGETPRLLERLNLRMPPSVSLRSTAPPQGGEPRPGAPCAPLQKGDAPLIRPLIRPFGPPSPHRGEGLGRPKAAPNKITKEEFSCPPITPRITT